MATTAPRVVIVGAGAVGCALADELTRRGHDRVTVLEKGALRRPPDAGPPVPGTIRRTSSSRSMARLADATARRYRDLRAGGAPCLDPTGGLEIATTPERLADLHRRRGWAAAAGIEARVVGPDECAGLHPLLDSARLLGGLYVPGDGVARTYDAARTQTRLATGRGAEFRAFHEVTAIERRAGRVTGVRCGDERFPADVVFCCAGSWGPLLGELAGVDVPLVPMALPFATTTPIAALETVHALESACGGAGPSIPMLRHQAAGTALFAHGVRLGIAGHGSRAVPLDPDRLDRPDRATAEALRFDAGDLDPFWAAAAELLPALDDAKVEDVVHRVVPVTPDGFPLLGEHPGLGGFWTAEAVGDAHAAGVAEALAEWIDTGRPALDGEPIDLSATYIGRFGPAAPDLVAARACRTIERIDAVVHPLDPPDAAAPVRTTPLRSRHVELRAAVAELDGTERPLWFDANGALPEVCEIDPRPGWAGRNRSPIAGAEALVTRRAAGLFDLSPLRRVEVAGPGALAHLQRLVTTDVDRPVGSTARTLMLDGGGVLATPVVARLGEQRFLVVVAGRLAADRLRTGGASEVSDVTEATACLGIRGPRTGEVLHDLIPGPVHDLDDGSADEFAVGDVPVTGLRVPGGWDLVCAADDAERLWDNVYVAGAQHGLIAAGWLAAESLRLEAGGRGGADLSCEHGPEATGLGDLLDRDAGDPSGRETGRVPAETLGTLVLEHPTAVLDGGEPVLDLPEARRFSRGPVPMDPTPDLAVGPVIGHVTSAALGYGTGTSLAHAWLPTPRAEPGTRVAVESFGRRIAARVVAAPLG